MAELEALLTPRLQATADQLLAALQEQRHWHGELPVLLLDRCWLKLRAVPVQRLAQVLPPDATAEVPELVRYRELQQKGIDELQALEQCWQEFGREACAQALRRYWQRQDQGNHGWTLNAFLDLMATYRRHLESAGATPLPLLVLARAGSPERHRLCWCWPAPPAMRHTCP